jgi:hypothetical protein
MNSVLRDDPIRGSSNDSSSRTASDYLAGKEKTCPQKIDLIDSTAEQFSGRWQNSQATEINRADETNRDQCSAASAPFNAQSIRRGLQANSRVLNETNPPTHGLQYFLPLRRDRL